MCKLMSSFFLCALCAVLQISCKDETINNYYQDGPVLSSSTQHTIVTDNPTAIVSYADLTNLTRGTVMKLRVNRDNFEVWEVNVIFDALYTVGADRLILCHTNSDFPVGAGDSGSPLLTSDGRIAGALCYGYEGNSNNFAARVIEDVLSIDTASVSSVSSSSSFSVIQPAYYLSGNGSQVSSRYARLTAVFRLNMTQAS